MILFVAVFVFFALGVPVAFALLVASFTYLAINGQFADLINICTTLGYSLDQYVMIAVPFFVLAAEIMNETEITERIYGFANAVVGRVPGALGQVNVVGSMIFAGMSGSGIADASGLGRIEIKAMTDQGYDRPFSAAITAASACIGPVIPPSIPMVIAGVITSTSVGALLMGGFIPGCLMGFGLMAVVHIRAIQRNYPRADHMPTLRSLVTAFKAAFFPLLTPLILLAGIMSGMFTPTEASAICCVYAIFISMVVYRTLTPRRLLRICGTVSIRTATILIVYSSAVVFGRLATRARLPHLLAETMMSITQDPMTAMFIMLGMFLLLGMFMEDMSLLVILGPILMPIAKGLGIDPVHFGVMMVMSLQVGMMSPPVGMTMFIACYYAEVDLLSYAKEAWPFFIALALVAVSLILFPQLVLFVPSLMAK